MDKYIYDPLDLDTLAFRIVRLQKGSGADIECELIHTRLDENVIPYEGVSYTWGSPAKTNFVKMQCTDVTQVQHRRFDATLNLWLILRDLRLLNEDRYLWIDAICINQDDVHERGHQVQQMRRIYTGAERVLFYVARHTEFTHLVITSLVKLQKEMSARCWAREDLRWYEAWGRVRIELKNQHFDWKSRYLQGLEHILNQSWFRRVWILQEVDSAKSALVYCGAESVSARIFAIAPRLARIEVAAHRQSVLDLMPDPVKRSKISKGWDLYKLLRKFWRTEAYDERDKVYALLGMCTDPVPITADYTKSISDIIHDLFIHVHPLRHIPDIRDGSGRPDSVAKFVEDAEYFERPTIAWHIHQGKYEDSPEIKSLLEFHGGPTIQPMIFSYESYTENDLEKRWRLYPDEERQFMLRERYGIHPSHIGKYNELVIAAKCRVRRAVWHLLWDGIDMKANGCHWMTPLQAAIKCGHIEIIETHLKRRWPIWRDYGSTPFLIALQKGDDDTFNLIIAHGMDGNAKSPSGWTASRSGIINNHDELVRTLWKKDADIEIGNKPRGPSGKTEKWDSKSIIRILSATKSQCRICPYSESLAPN